MIILTAVLALISPGNVMTSSPPQQAPDQAQVEIGVDPRVELLSIVFRVAGAEEYQRSRVSSYAEDVDTYFAPFSDHEAIRQVHRLRQNLYISHDAVIKLAVHLEDVQSLEESVPLDKVTTLGVRWKAEPARAFLGSLRSFVEATRFDRFLAQHQKLYIETDARLRRQLSEDDLLWLDEYFGATSRSLQVIPGMLTGRASYGASVRRARDPDRFAIVGVESVDRAGLPDFDRSVVESVVHELCHSYVRPLLDEYGDELEVSAGRLYLSQRRKMEVQGYRNAYTVMNETLTRACTNRFLQAKGQPEEVVGDYAYNRSRGFLWIEEVSQQLERYENERKRFPTFVDFGSELTRFFSELTDKLPASQEELDELRPRVREVKPADGETGVDPDLEAIEVIFDQPMRTDSWSVVRGRQKYPETDTPSFTADGTRFFLPVELEPETEYEIWLNRGPHQSFASRAGIPLAPLQITFTTGPRR